MRESSNNAITVLTYTHELERQKSLDHGEPNSPSLTSKTCPKPKRARRDWIFCHETHLPNFQCLKFHKDHNQKVSMTFPCMKPTKELPQIDQTDGCLKATILKTKQSNLVFSVCHFQETLKQLCLRNFLVRLVNPVWWKHQILGKSLSHI